MIVRHYPVSPVPKELILSIFVCFVLTYHFCLLSGLLYFLINQLNQLPVTMCKVKTISTTVSPFISPSTTAGACPVVSPCTTASQLSAQVPQHPQLSARVPQHTQLSPPVPQHTQCSTSDPQQYQGSTSEPLSASLLSQT